MEIRPNIVLRPQRAKLGKSLLLERLNDKIMSLLGSSVGEGRVVRISGRWRVERCGDHGEWHNYHHLDSPSFPPSLHHLVRRNYFVREKSEWSECRSPHVLLGLTHLAWRVWKAGVYWAESVTEQNVLDSFAFCLAAAVWSGCTLYFGWSSEAWCRWRNPGDNILGRSVGLDRGKVVMTWRYAPSRGDLTLFNSSHEDSLNMTDLWAGHHSVGIFRFSGNSIFSDDCASTECVPTKNPNYLIWFDQKITGQIFN